MITLKFKEVQYVIHRCYLKSFDGKKHEKKEFKNSNVGTETA